MILQDIYAGTLQLTEMLRDSEAAREAAEVSYRDISSQLASVQKDFEYSSLMRQALEHEIELLKASQQKLSVKILELQVEKGELTNEKQLLNAKLCELENVIALRSQHESVVKEKTRNLHIVSAQKRRIEFACACVLEQWRFWKRAQKLVKGKLFRSSCSIIRRVLYAFARNCQLRRTQRLQECAILIQASLATERIRKFIYFWRKVLNKHAFRFWAEWKSFKKKLCFLLRIGLRKGRSCKLFNALERWMQQIHMTKAEENAKIEVTMKQQFESASELNRSNEKCINILLQKQQEMEACNDELQYSNKIYQEQLALARSDLKSLSIETQKCRENGAVSRVFVIVHLWNKVLKRKHFHTWNCASCVERELNHLHNLSSSRISRSQKQRYFSFWIQHLDSDKFILCENQRRQLQNDLELLERLYSKAESQVALNQKQQEEAKSIELKYSVVRITRAIQCFNNMFKGNHFHGWKRLCQRRQTMQRILQISLSKFNRILRTGFFYGWASIKQEQMSSALGLRNAVLEQELVAAMEKKNSAEQEVSFMLEQRRRMDLASSQYALFNQDLEVKVASIEFLLKSAKRKQQEHIANNRICRIYRFIGFWNRRTLFAIINRWIHSQKAATYTDMWIRNCTVKRICGLKTLAFVSWSRFSLTARSKHEIHDCKQQLSSTQAWIVSLESQHARLQESHLELTEQIQRDAENKARRQLQASLTRVTRVIVHWTAIHARHAIHSWWWKAQKKRRRRDLCIRQIAKSLQKLFGFAFMLWLQSKQEAKIHLERLHTVALEQKLVAIANMKDLNAVSLISMAQVQQNLEAMVQESSELRRRLEKQLEEAETEKHFTAFKHQRERRNRAAHRIFRFGMYWHILLLRHMFRKYCAWFINKCFLRYVLRIGLKRHFVRTQTQVLDNWKSIEEEKISLAAQDILTHTQIFAGIFERFPRSSLRIEMQQDGLNLRCQDILPKIKSEVMRLMDMDRHNRIDRSYQNIARVVLHLNRGILKNAFCRKWWHWTLQKRLYQNRKTICSRWKSRKLLVTFMNAWIHVYLRPIFFFVMTQCDMYHPKKLFGLFEFTSFASQPFNSKSSGSRYYKHWLYRCAMESWRQWSRRKMRRRCVSVRASRTHSKALISDTFADWATVQLKAKLFQQHLQISRQQKSINELIGAKVDAEAQIAFLLEAQRQREGKVSEFLANNQTLQDRLLEANQEKDNLEKRHREEILKSIARRTIAVWTKASMRKAFNQWQHTVLNLVHQRRRMKVCLAKMSGLLLLNTFLAWIQLYCASREARLTAQREKNKGSRRCEIDVEFQACISRISRFLKFWSRLARQRVFNALAFYAQARQRLRRISRNVKMKHERYILYRMFLLLATPLLDALQDKHKLKADEIEQIWSVKYGTLKASLQQHIEAHQNQKMLSAKLHEVNSNHATSRVMKVLLLWRKNHLRSAFTVWKYWYANRSRRRRLHLKAEWRFQVARMKQLLQHWTDSNFYARTHAEKVEFMTVNRELTEVTAKRTQAESRIAALHLEIRQLEDDLTSAKSMHRSTMAQIQDAELNRAVSRILRVLKHSKACLLKRVWIRLETWLFKTRWTRRTRVKIAIELSHKAISRPFIAWYEYRNEAQRLRALVLEERLLTATEMKADKAQSDISFLLNQLKIMLRAFEELLTRLSAPVGPSERAMARDNLSTKADLGRWKAEAEVLRLEAQWQSLDVLALP